MYTSDILLDKKDLHSMGLKNERIKVNNLATAPAGIEKNKRRGVIPTDQANTYFSITIP